MKKKHVYKGGEFAYLSENGEIVRILGSTTKPSFLSSKNYLKVVSLKDIDPTTGKASRHIECPQSSVLPILDEDVQLMLKMVYLSKEFSLLRRL